MESAGVIACQADKFSRRVLRDHRLERPELRSREPLFNSGNITNHFYTVTFLSKKISTIDWRTGEIIKPNKLNDVKLAPCFTQKEFTPLDNAPGVGSDVLETGRQDLLDKYQLENAGPCLMEGVKIGYELSPLVTY
ncbi:hypothetical protein OG21DRAFT_1526068 [Imleria badia]|nr:hypothetical protein OG21DRAFT_1526068 [Imleria badia]